jgi:hypothetical protein
MNEIENLKRRVLFLEVFVLLIVMVLVASTSTTSKISISLNQHVINTQETDSILSEKILMLYENDTSLISISEKIVDYLVESSANEKN